MIKHNFLHWLILLLFANFGNAANILAMVPLPLRSHTSNFMPIFIELATRGHNVTVVSPFPQKTSVPNLTDVVVPNLWDKLMAMGPMNSMQDMNSLFAQLFGLWMFGLSATPLALQTEPLQKLIKDTDSKFDLIITESWFIQEPLVAFGHKFNAPVIGIMPAFLLPMVAQLTGNHLPLSYMPMVKLGFNDRMTYMNRVMNFFQYYWEIIGGHFYLRKMDILMREHFKYPGSENLPPLEDMLRNISLTLMDHNSAISYPVPLHKNIIPFGGISINKHPDKLPADLKKIMDSAKDGFIYFSLGSVFSVSLLNQESQDSIFAALSKAKLKVLIKLNDPSLIQNYTYKNLEARKWFPQVAVLAHPNCKLFITHGGIHGVMEGLYNELPMVAIPFFADQEHNAKFVETTGIGAVLDKWALTEEKVSNAIGTVLTDPSYRENVKKRSAIFKDTPIDIMDNVIYWIEYVISHKGAPHLRPAVLDLHWYQYLMLDVLALYLFVILLVVYVIKYVLSTIFVCIKCVLFRKQNCKKDKNKPKKE